MTVSRPNSSQIGSQIDLGALTTEAANPSTSQLDQMTTIDRLYLMNAEDAKVAGAVALEIPKIALAVEGIVKSLSSGGRLIYIGAGTSGRLGVLDASECPPTFGTDPGKVVAVIAGGPDAMFRAIEGAEDSADLGVQAVDELALDEHDSVVGISASGQAPFVCAALQRAGLRGAFTIGLTNNGDAELQKFAQVTIAPIVGPESIAGSTRMKAGTAQKMVLNLLSTNAMIELGKTYGNLMVDVRATNSKLLARALRMVMTLAETDDIARATEALESAGGSAKLAILILRSGLSPDAAQRCLDDNGGFLRKALAEAQQRKL